MFALEHSFADDICSRANTRFAPTFVIIYMVDAIFIQSFVRESVKLWKLSMVLKGDVYDFMLFYESFYFLQENFNVWIEEKHKIIDVPF